MYELRSNNGLVAREDAREAILALANPEALTEHDAKIRLEEAKRWKPSECQQGHRPFRSPICRACQQMARWEERIAELGANEADGGG
jgi:hypothetical protein